jgi:hypothetical protein
MIRKQLDLTPSLTRRRADNPHLITWHVDCGDVLSARSANSTGALGVLSGIRHTWG